MICFGLVKVINSILIETGDNNELEINYLWDHSSKYAYSVFYGQIHYFYTPFTTQKLHVPAEKRKQIVDLESTLKNTYSFLHQIYSLEKRGRGGGVDFFFAGGGFLSEGVLARGGILQEGVFCRRGVLVGGGFCPEGGFCPVPKLSY